MSRYQQELQEAVEDLHLYLSDQKPPLMVCDSVTLLMGFPADVMATEISAWLANQRIEGAPSDYLYHAAKKINALADLELVPRDRLDEYRPRLAEALIKHAPENERDLLKQNLDRLGTPSHTTSMVRRPLAQPGANSPPPPPAAEQPLTRELRHLSLMLEHLRPLAAAPPEQKQILASQFMATAAKQSTTGAELQQRLRPLGEVGIDIATAQIFRTLADNVAGWIVPRGEGQAAPPPSEQMQAMRQIVTLTDDPAESAKRFREMVHAAIDQFNRGELGRAVTMFEMAELLISENKIKPVYVEALRKDGHPYLDQVRLKKFADRTELRPQLRTILNFFVALQPVGLLKALDGEAERDKRHQLLALLEVHGAPARDAAWEMLKASVAEGEQPNPFLQMNLVYLLRIITTRPATLTVDEEVGVVVRVSGRTSPPPLVKQVIAYLAHVRHEKAEKALFSYLKVFETMALNPASAVYPPAELDKLLDRTCAGLARYGTPRAWTLMVDHGLKTDPRLQNPYLRLTEAGRFDLSASKDLVLKVVAAITAELPRSGIMSLGAKTNESKAIALMQALAGTPLPEVTELFTKVAEKHPGKLAEAANKGLSNLATLGKPPVQPAFSGSLEIFGLPNVLQTIAQSQLSGVLSVVTEAGKPQASLVFSKGAFLRGDCGKITGAEAVYQLLERPFPGTFALVNRPDTKGGPPTPGEEVFGLLMEGVRRHDELKRAVAIVPDGAKLKTTGKPNPVPAGEDQAFADLIWKEVSAGKTPAEVEALINTDAYRVRQAICFWVDEGALVQAAA